MDLWATLLIAFSVSLDAFALSVAGALTSRQSLRRNALLAAGFFGGFQFLMPLAGFLAAASLQRFFAAIDHWIAFVLLAIVGGRMICDGVRKKDSSAPAETRADFFNWKFMFVPAVATSIDALAVGAGIAFSGEPILVPAAAMGIVTGAMSAVGVCFGKHLGRVAGARLLSIVGGTAIVLIGADILRRHLTAG